MGVSVYDNVWTALVPLGYIIALPTTESSMLPTPSHPDFGLDLAFLINKLKSEGTNASSPFYQKIAATSAIMGHSMGGGSSFLACQNNTVPTVMVTFAAANTTPSSIDAATNITIPALVISGELDCVAPPAEHQIPMFDSLASDCKVYISIKNGGHCYFANYNFTCTFGEETCYAGGVPLSRAEQQATAMNFVKPYLDYFLKNNASAWNTFVDSLTNSTKVTYVKNCMINPTALDKIADDSPKMNLFPNPASDELTIYLSYQIHASVVITDITGKEVAKANTGDQVITMDISKLEQGLYLVKLIRDNGLTLTHKFIKI